MRLRGFFLRVVRLLGVGSGLGAYYSCLRGIMLDNSGGVAFGEEPTHLFGVGE
jgi:hypothetical protein